jgi:DnaJ-class molecular chaperone
VSKFKTIRRIIFVTCPNCVGRGTLITKNGLVACPDCNGRGETERIINEIVHDEDVKAGI